MKKIMLTTILALGLTTSQACPVKAEEQIFITPGTAFDNTNVKVAKFVQRQSLSQQNKIPVGEIQLSIVHPDFLDKKQFGLLFKHAYAETGCHEFSPIEYEAKYIEKYYMDISLKHFRSNLKETQAPSYDCEQKYKVASGMIILSADDLAKKGIKQIRFNNGQGRDTYDVAVLENAVRLTPKSMVAFKAQNLQGPDKTYIQYNFVDNSLLKLQVPMAQTDDNVAQAVRDLAYKSTLQPVFKREGLDTFGENNVFYFTDPNATTLGQIGKEGYMELGTIIVNRPYDGPNGRVAMPVPLKVFATRQDVTL